MTKRKKINNYVAIQKQTNEIATSSTKSGIAWFLGISYRTVHRKLNLSSRYECDKYIIWRDVPHIKARQKRI